MSLVNVGKKVIFVVEKTIDKEIHDFEFEGVIANWSEKAGIYEIYCPPAAIMAHGQVLHPLIRVKPEDVIAEIKRVAAHVVQFFHEQEDKQ